MERGERFLLVVVLGTIVLWAWIVGPHTPMHFFPSDPNPAASLEMSFTPPELWPDSEWDVAFYPEVELRGGS